jgi:hypothetical protein
MHCQVNYEELAREKRPAIFDGLNAIFTADQWNVIERGMAYFATLVVQSQHDVIAAELIEEED